jgi:hypothetical protein
MSEPISLLQSENHNLTREAINVLLLRSKAWTWCMRSVDSHTLHYRTKRT